MLLGELQARGRLVEPAVYDVLHRVRQCKIAVIRQHSPRECAQKRLDRLGMPVKYQTERVICKQPGRIHPIARRLQMSDRFNRLAVIGKPVRGQSVQLWDFGGRGSPQLQAQQLSEQLVVPKPGTFGSTEKTNAFASSRSRSIFSDSDSDSDSDSEPEEPV